VAYLSRRYDEAFREGQKVIDMDPSFPSGHLVLAFVYEQQGKVAEAIAEYKKMFSLEGDEETAKAIADTYAASGYEAAMRKLVSRMLNRPGGLRPPLGFIAQIQARLGDKDEAITNLERACDERGQELAEFVVDPVFDDLRSDPRFQALVRRIGLEP
jgi:tetratricopeptide (TPR) repeat protein